jgi:hypothetical protein
MKTLKPNASKLFVAALTMAAALLQNCKKQAINTPTTAVPEHGMYALINDTAWTAESVTASLEYDAASTSRIFTCQGTMGNKVIQLTAYQSNVAAGNDFPLGAANNSLDNFAYFILPVHRNLTEQNVTLGNTPGAGMVITSIDTGKRLISGTFAFPMADSAYDAFGGLTAVQQNLVKKGVFKEVHYVYTP